MPLTLLLRLCGIKAVEYKMNKSFFEIKKTLLVFLLLICALFSYGENIEQNELTQVLDEDGLRVSLSVSTNEFSLAGVPIFLQVQIDATPNASARMPEDLSPYLDGFVVDSSFWEENGTNGLSKCYNYKLIPIASPNISPEERKIFPIDICVVDKSFLPPKEKYIFSKEFLFKVEKLAEPAVVSHNITSEHIPYNHWLTLIYAGYALLAIVVCMLLWLLIKYARMKHKLRMMTPKERALTELQQLIAKRLIDKGCIKDFYVELTHVVRRYIERRYGIKAPERTTEEFIKEAIALPSFPQEHIPVLEKFLVSADMVKFAKQEATKLTADSATQSAKDYIELDSSIEVDTEKRLEQERRENLK